MQKTMPMTILGRTITFFNQRCEDWTHPYEYQGRGTLKTSGCGIFSLCHCAQWLTGRVPSAEDWADFAVQYGGRGDDGTDRPLLLHTLSAHHRAEALGFRYEEDGLLNDQERLFDFLQKGQGVSMGNIRVGHIVTFLSAREINGEKQLLVLDSAADNANPRVVHGVREVLPDTLVTVVDDLPRYGAYWVDLAMARDYNLLHRISFT